MSKKVTTEEFKEKANKIHNNKYNYSKFNYINQRIKSIIICSEHGEFEQAPRHHLQGSNCPKCIIDKKTSNLNEFIYKANIIHNNTYDYSKFKYKKSQTKGIILCSEHGEFEQKANSHLNGQGCPKCGGKFMDLDYFIEKSNKIHNNKYDYSKVIYIHNKKPVCIICPIHDEFEQIPSDHLNGVACPKCGIEKKRSNINIFIENANLVHNNKYDYSKFIYKSSIIKGIIICPIHSEFEQNAQSHLNGRGCPICNESKLEKQIKQLLNKENILFETQKRFDWLGRQSLDFYLPEYNVAIECQGGQHFIHIKRFGGEEKLNYTKERDLNKFNLCTQNNIKLLYYTNKEYLKYGNNYFSKLFVDKEELLKEITL